MSALVTKLLKYMEIIAPLKLADKSWDNVGLLVEAPHHLSQLQSLNQTNILLTIDLTPDVMQEVKSLGNIGAIVSYHPVIFKGLKQLTCSDPKQRAILECIASGISVFCPHTSLDACTNGINDWLISTFEGTSKPITPSEPGASTGAGRLLKLHQPLALNDVVDKVKKHLGLSHVRLAQSSKNPEPPFIRTIAVCAGSGSSVLLPVEADLYLTGEMSHHEVLEAIGNGTHVILCEHTNTERGFLAEVLKPTLQAFFENEVGNSTKIIVSQTDKDPLQIV